MRKLRAKIRNATRLIRFDPAASDYQKYVFEIVLAIGIFVLFALNLPYVQVATLETGSYQATATDFEIDLQTLARPTKTGWPVTFYHAHTFGSKTVSDFTFAAFVFDGLICLLLLVALGFYFWPRRKRLRSSKKLQSQLVYGGIALAALVVAFVYWLSLLAAERSDHRIAQQLENAGASVLRVAYIPDPIATVCPEFILRSQLRIALVAMDQPTDQQVALALAQPELRSLRLSGDTYATDALRRLADLSFLQDISIKATNVEGDVGKVFRDCALVSNVNLTATTVDQDGLRSIAAMPRLYRLSLLGTGVGLPAITESKLDSRVAELILSRPHSGSDVFSLKEWDQLRRLALLSPGDQWNDQPLLLSLTGMQQLETVFVDPIQLVEFTGSDLPLFQGLRPMREIDFSVIGSPTELFAGDSDDSLRRGRLSEAELESLRDSGIWVNSFRLNNAKMCQALSLSARSLVDLNIEDDCEKLKSLTLLGAKYLSLHDSIPQEIRQRVIELAGQPKGKPPTLRLLGMKLTDLDLEDLTLNKRIGTLDLTNCDVELSSLKTFEGEMGQLEALNLTGIDVQPQTFIWAKDTFPKLQELVVSAGNAKRVIIENHDYMERVVLDSYVPSRIDAIRLTNLRSWKAPVNVSSSALLVDMQNVPELEGLCVPNPCKLIISRLDGLKWFASGGSNCNDPVVAEILKAKELQRLTMLYPVASVSAFDGLMGLTKIESLNLSGSSLNDDFFKSWTVPASLKIMILDDCNISGSTLAGLLNHLGWQGLSIANTNISPIAIKAIAGLENLRALGLGGLTLDETCLRAFQTLPNLEYLDLSNATLPAASVELISKLQSLKRINLRGCGLSDVDLELIRQAIPAIDITETDNAWKFMRSVESEFIRPPAEKQFEMPMLTADQFKPQPAASLTGIR